MLTLNDIIDEVQIATRSALRDELSEPGFANRVGRRWSHMHRWRYLDGGAHLFSTVEGQVDYAMPADMSELDVIFGEKDEYTAWEVVSLVSWADWHTAVRRDIGTFWGRFYGATKYGTIDVDGIEQSRLILSLTPKPQGPRELRAIYRRTWEPLVEGVDAANVPTWAEEPFLELVRIMAIALNAPSTDGNPDPMGAMIANFRLGTSFADAKRSDGLASRTIQRAVGAIEPYLAQTLNEGNWYPRSTSQDLLAGL